MRPIALALAYVAIALVAGVAGWMVRSTGMWTEAGSRVGSSIDEVRAAEARSFFGAHPIWMDSKDAARLQSLRDQGYRFCLDRKKTDDRLCEAQQDQAVAFIGLLPELLRYQEQIDPAKRTPKQSALATMPGGAQGVQRYCWTLYPSGDTADARIAAACLSNLIEGGIVVPLPVS